MKREILFKGKLRDMANFTVENPKYGIIKNDKK